MIADVLRMKPLKKGIVAQTLRFDNVPIEFLSDTSITSFYMNDNKLTSVPPLIGQLTVSDEISIFFNKQQEYSIFKFIAQSNYRTSSRNLVFIIHSNLLIL